MSASQRFRQAAALATCAGLAISLSLLLGEQPGEAPRPTLPIYRVSAGTRTADRLQKLARHSVRADGVCTAATGNRLRLRSGKKVAEIHQHSGGFWAADHDHLWNPNARPTLPSPAEAVRLAHQFLKANQWLPEPGVNHPIRVTPANQPCTRMARFDVKTGKRTDCILDRQVNFTTTLQVSGPGGQVQTLPVVGGGGEFNVTLGHQGQVIAHSGVWRPIDKVEQMSPLKPRAQVDEQYRQLVARAGLKLVSQSVSLAYYSAPAAVEQKFLYPVYVYMGEGDRNGARVSLRTVLLPATEFIPPASAPVAPLAPQPERTAKDLPLPGSLLPEAQKDPLKQREAAASWQDGTTTGANATGFVAGLKKDGWTINFNWGAGNAWASDWAEQADSWVDAADLVFYTGTVNAGDGWYLWDPHAGHAIPLTAGRVQAVQGSVGPLWGRQDLEWIVIAGCGPLQDSVLKPFSGDALDHWKGTFHGLHQILGYASKTVETTEEGRLFTRYCCEDEETTIHAWFRTAKELQPSHTPDGAVIYAAVMYAGCYGKTSPAEDHLWGHGFVAEDPVVPDYYVVIWTPT